jgi:1,4-dihydroxy-2-naphthoate octaprenyltransferase
VTPGYDRWVLAARPATLWAAVAPVLVGSAIAVDDGAFRLDAFVLTLFAALAIQVGVNFANDLADAAKGADTAARIGPARAVAEGLISPREMRRGIVVAFGLAAMAGLYLIWLGGWVILAIGVVSIVAALGYTNGPIPYGYRGLGELFVFVFFGLVATVGTRYVFDRTAPEAAWIAAIPLGLLAAAILVANNLRDIETDRTAGKRTLAVMIGRTRTRVLYATLVQAGYAVMIWAALFDVLPPWTLLTLLTMPLSIRLARVAATETAGPPLIGVLKGTARLQLVFAVFLAAGIVA